MFKNAAEYCVNVCGSEVFEEDGVIIGFFVLTAANLFILMIGLIKKLKIGWYVLFALKLGATTRNNERSYIYNMYIINCYTLSLF